MQAVNTAMRELRLELEARTAQANEMFRENAAVLEESRNWMAQIAQQPPRLTPADRRVPVCLAKSRCLSLAGSRRL